MLLILLQIDDEKNVYDLVEESEYSDMVRQRQEDDWIVDDGKKISLNLLLLIYFITNVCVY